MDTLVKVPVGQLRIARIVYFTDLIHSDSRELPVGIVAEVTLPDLRGIGTALRPGFPAAELAMMGPTARELLTSPTDYLWPICKDTFLASERGQTLDQLMALYSSSLSILAPATIEVPRQWLITSVERRTESVEKRFRVTLEDEYYKFLFPPRETDPEVPTIEEEITPAKAA
jgi:hypothetical protein